MKSKLKIALWSIAVILILGIATAAFFWARKPQVITFDSGDKVTLLKVDYGKRHAPPGVKPPTTTNTTARVIRNRGGAFTTTNDTLVVWVRQQYDSKQYANFQYFAYDKSGEACVGANTYSMGGRQGNEVVGIRLDGFPRRQGKFFLRVQENSNSGQEIADQKFVIRNPERESFSNWSPDPLPNTQEDDDLSVTLTKLAAGAAMPYTRDNDDPDDAMNKGVQATFEVQRNGKPVTNWEPVSVETSDATGNHVEGWIAKNDWNGNDDVATYQYGLWPDEPAWKIRLEFSQKSDFADSELWTVQDVPVVPGKQQEMWNYGGNRRQMMTNSPFAENDLNGYHLKIFPAKDFTDSGQNNFMQGGLFVQVSPGLADGFRMTVKITDDQTNEIQHNDYGSTRNNNISTFRYSLQDIAGLTNLNVSVALHKSRFVEFTAKPEQAPAAAAQ